jgi:hypothetical protein
MMADTMGVFDRWVQDCPLLYSSPNASSPSDVLGILAGSKRYAHMAGVRGDSGCGVEAIIDVCEQQGLRCLLSLSGRSKARREALTSRPLLPACMGRATSSGNQTTLYLTPMHAQSGLIKFMAANVQAAIQHVKAAAEQLPKLGRWATLLACICRRIVGQIALPVPPPTLTAPG